MYFTFSDHQLNELRNSLESILFLRNWELVAILCIFTIIIQKGDLDKSM